MDLFDHRQKRQADRMAAVTGLHSLVVDRRAVELVVDRKAAEWTVVRKAVGLGAE